MQNLSLQIPMTKEVEKPEMIAGETVLEINLEAVKHNFHYLKSKIAPNIQFMAVVKANSYGSDASEIALELEKEGADYFAVAYSSEGEILRKAGIKKPILVLHPLLANFDIIRDNNLEPALYSKKILNAFLEFLKIHKLSDYPVHLKINTGLNRLGFEPEEIADVAEGIAKAKEMRVRSIFSHLVASEDDKETDFTRNQIRMFEKAGKVIFEKLGYTPLLHCTNTSAIIRYPEARFDMVRSGIGLYGYTYDPAENKNLAPVATLKTVISQLHNIKTGESVGYNRGFIAEKPTKSATLPIGHADGFLRAFGKGKGWVIINGKKAKVLGNVCMDMVMVDVTDIECKEGDEVLVFGAGAPADELAAAIDTISYELLTGISSRVKRITVKNRIYSYKY